MMNATGRSDWLGQRIMRQERGEFALPLMALALFACSKPIDPSPESEFRHGRLRRVIAARVPASPNKRRGGKEMMTNSLAASALRLLSDSEIAMIAGGNYEDSGPTAAEIAIEDMFANWSAPLSSGDAWTSYMADNAMFWDRDQNGYYDYVEISSDTGVYIFNAEAEVWVCRAYDNQRPT